MAIRIIDTVGEAYNRFFRSGTLLTIGFLGALVTLALSLLMTQMLAPFSAAQINQSAVIALLTSPVFWVELVVTLIVFGLIVLFIAGTMISAVAEGGKATICSAARNTASRYVSLVGTCIVGGIVGIVGMVPMAVVFAIALLENFAPNVTGLLVMVGAALFVIPIYISLRISLADAFCVVGGKRAVASVKGSWSIIKGNLWGMLGIMMIVVLIEVLISMPISLFINRAVGEFVELMLSYPITVAFVLVYMQLAGTTGRKPKAGAKRKR